MLKPKKRLVMSLLSIAMLVIPSIKAFAVGTVGNSNINPNPRNSVVNQYIDTSHWELKRKTRIVSFINWRTEQVGFPMESPANPMEDDDVHGVTAMYYKGYWTPKWGSNGNVIGMNYIPPYTSTTENWKYAQVAWWDTREEVYYQWEIQPSGYSSTARGQVTITKKQKYVYTKSNVKENGERAGLDYDVRINNISVRNEDGYYVGAEILNPQVYHKVVRYQNKGLYVQGPVTNNINITGNNARFVGRMEYPYGGNESSEFVVEFTAKIIDTIVVSTSQEGVNQTVQRAIYVPVKCIFNMPINGFNSVNYTGHSSRQTPLIFKGVAQNQINFSF